MSWAGNSEMSHTSKKDRLVPYGPAGVMLMENFNLPVMDRVKDFQCTKEDILLCSFPKTGTTWMQAIISLIMQATETGQSGPIKGDRDIKNEWTFLEVALPSRGGEPPIEAAKRTAPPRLCLTHLSWELLPPSAVTNKSKIVYISRNVKDVIVSQYEMYSKVKHLASAHAVESFDEFAESFIQDNVHYAPYFHNFESYWDHRCEPNVHFLTYEDLHKDASAQIKLLANFPERPISDEQAQQIAVLTKFENMSQNNNLNKAYGAVKDPTTGEVVFQFLRKGVVSGWASHISEDLRARIDDWTRKEAAKNGLDVAHFM